MLGTNEATKAGNGDEVSYKLINQECTSNLMLT